jgi:hypothetical protein
MVQIENEEGLLGWFRDVGESASDLAGTSERLYGDWLQKTPKCQANIQVLGDRKSAGNMSWAAIREAPQDRISNAPNIARGGNLLGHYPSRGGVDVLNVR